MINFSLLTPMTHTFIIAAREIGAACGTSIRCIRSSQELKFSYVIQGKDS
jgi:hypothetical protein